MTAHFYIEYEHANHVFLNQSVVVVNNKTPHNTTPKQYCYAQVIPNVVFCF